MQSSRDALMLPCHLGILFLLWVWVNIENGCFQHGSWGQRVDNCWEKATVGFYLRIKICWNSSWYTSTWVDLNMNIFKILSQNKSILKLAKSCAEMDWKVAAATIYNVFQITYSKNTLMSFKDFRRNTLGLTQH